MKKEVSLLILFLLLGEFAWAGTVKIIFATGEWPPATSEKLPEYGFVTQIVTKACLAVSLKPEYRFYPWKRAEAMVKSGKIIAAFPYMITDERKKDYNYSDPLFYGINYFIYYDKNPNTPRQIEFNNLKDLMGYKIGMIRGTPMEAELRQKGLNVEVTTTLDQSIIKLTRGRLDFYLTEQMVFRDAIQRLFPTQTESFKKLPRSYGPKRPNALLVSRQFPDAESTIKRFNKGLRMIRENGLYEQITRPYLLSE